MIVCALDPSFSNTGIAKCDTERKTLVVDSVKGDGRKHSAFQDIQNSIHMHYMPMLSEKVAGTDALVTEEPFPFGSFSSGLYALDTAICQTFFGILKKTYNPRTLEFIHDCRKHGKSQSKELASGIIDVFRNSGYEVQTKTKGHDGAEALIYLVHYCLSMDVFQDGMPERFRSLNEYIGMDSESKKKKKTKKTKDG